MQRRLTFSESEFYHLYNRGVDKRKIFVDDRDRKRFVKLLYVANGERSFVFRDIEKLPLSEIERGDPLVAIGAYVLMPNHFHILVKEIRKAGTSSFMEKLLTGYATYFNKRRDRTGRLFQNTFQARHLNRDEYLKYIFAYIHLNPVKLLDPHWKERGIRNKTAVMRYLKEYTYSSYLDYVGVFREEKKILSKQEFPEYFLQAFSFENFLKDWLASKEST